MISDAELAKVLRDTGQGEMIMAGTILKGLSKEQIAWVVLEVVEIRDIARYTLHAYWHDIFVVSKVVSLTKEGNLIWGKSAA